jgi:hypothetical protein
MALMAVHSDICTSPSVLNKPSPCELCPGLGRHRTRLPELRFSPSPFMSLRGPAGRSPRTHGFRSTTIPAVINNNNNNTKPCASRLHVVLLSRATCRICKRDVIALMKAVIE